MFSCALFNFFQTCVDTCKTDCGITHSEDTAEKEKDTCEKVCQCHIVLLILFIHTTQAHSAIYDTWQGQYFQACIKEKTVEEGASK